MRIDPRPPLPPTSEGPEKPQGVEGVQPVNPRQGARFDALLGGRRAAARKALRQDVDQAGELEALDPALFADPRSLELLDHILGEVLPRLELDPDVRTLAEDMIREEIHMREHLQQQRSEAKA
ncbi:MULTISPECIES: hypothetical protein [unclassified Pseudomonas]|uniref:hypothetical protein n=1 Tax=unclassified Pseudomonas TaxID=196821 RepID=UPI000BDC290F|nr:MULTISPECIES: hypothetical protein [unclassified Pseudomonas]PVZ12524.1 hypothetical protein F474_03321 [Pseudomonas sp. URIL14HWK12:I12]PVZ23324.1 hypothetical protein F470_02881 [Pseudomonas sp. URIL14HWK12:I10]PVZ32654.1 hypothetical protein F472_03229 [Pseudomonas sp. URIL14HWK12:I11]SNZ13808.1 hypothetical protein SAMN05660463_02578 [Pseudomonas sp. URIL14HWK12:I9]